MIILGISCFHHDSAVAIIKDGEILFAAMEERFSRIKHDKSFPLLAIQHALTHSSLTIEQVDAVVFYEKPLRKFIRIIENFISYYPTGVTSFPNFIFSWFSEKLMLDKILKEKCHYSGKILYSSHHISHAASAYYTSPFNDCAFVVMDGVGEKCSTSFGVCEKNKIIPMEEVSFPHSLGILYSAFTAYLGFQVNEGEYKVMGLAPYGQDTYSKIILDKMITLEPEGLFSLNNNFFNFFNPKAHYNEEAFIISLGFPPRKKPTDPITNEHKNLARSIQEVLEQLIIRILLHVKKTTEKKCLVLSGGVALNCVANSRFLKDKIFDDVHIYNNPGDAGAALGAALWYYYNETGREYKGTKKINNYLGPEYSDQEIESILKNKNILYHPLYLCDIVDLLIDQKVVGWFQGRMEFGPRALGNRSILADARNKENWNKVNLKIKFRENFRPFAPVILEEFSNKYYQLNGPSPEMMYVFTNLTDQLPATTHLDNTSRIQTLNKTENEKLYNLLNLFYLKTGTPSLINTSLNLNNDPIACHPQDALNVFLKSEMDVLVLGNFVIRK